VPENIQFSFHAVFFTQLNCTVQLKVYRALYTFQFCGNHWKTNLNTAAEALSLLYLNDGPASAWFCGVHCECWAILWKDISSKKKNTVFGKPKSLEKSKVIYFVTRPLLNERKFRQYYCLTLQRQNGVTFFAALWIALDLFLEGLLSQSRFQVPVSLLHFSATSIIFSRSPQSLFPHHVPYSC
jgi:hypothetical protein